MLRTAIASLLALLLGWGAARWLTHDFQAWTDEGARRLEVALHPVPAPPVLVQGPGVAAVELPALLAQGGASIVDFVYTRCQTVCLSLGSSFQQMQSALQEGGETRQAHDVQLLSVSFDGRHDDVAALAAYARRMNADPGLWRFVSTPDSGQQQTLLRALGVVVVPDGRGDFEHNAALLVFDRRGRMLRVFDLSEQQLALDYARHLARAGTP